MARPKNARRPRPRRRNAAIPALTPREEQKAMRLVTFLWASLQMMTPVMESFLTAMGFGPELRTKKNPSDNYLMTKILRRERRNPNSRISRRLKGFSVTQMEEAFAARNAIAHNDLYAVYHNWKSYYKSLMCLATEMGDPALAASLKQHYKDAKNPLVQRPAHTGSRGNRLLLLLIDSILDHLVPQLRSFLISRGFQNQLTTSGTPYDFQLYLDIIIDEQKKNANFLPGVSIATLEWARKGRNAAFHNEQALALLNFLRYYLAFENHATATGSLTTALNLAGDRQTAATI